MTQLTTTREAALEAACRNLLRVEHDSTSTKAESFSLDAHEQAMRALAMPREEAPHERAERAANLPEGWIPDPNDPSADAADRWDELGVDRFSPEASAWWAEVLRRRAESANTTLARSNRALADEASALRAEVARLREALEESRIAGDVLRARVENMNSVLDAVRRRNDDDEAARPCFCVALHSTWPAKHSIPCEDARAALEGEFGHFDVTARDNAILRAELQETRERWATVRIALAAVLDDRGPVDPDTVSGIVCAAARAALREGGAA